MMPWRKNIYFRNKREYVTVNVFVRINEMQKAVREYKCDDAAAVFIPGLYSIVVSVKGDTRKIPKQIGSVYFNCERMGAGFVAHEFAHAVFHYHAAHGLDPINKHSQEEAFCYELTKLVRDYWNWYYKTIAKGGERL